MRISTVPFIVVLFLHVTSLYSQDTKENAEFRLAVSLYNDNFLAQAEDQFKVFIDKFPNTSLGIEARFYLGLIQLKTKKYGDAKNTFQDFALRYQDNPKAPDAWWNLAEIYALERNYAEAASAFARIKTFYPKHKKTPEALLQASRLFQKAGDEKNARLVLNSILIEYAQSEVVLDATYELGRLLLTTGDYEPAQRELRRIVNSAVAPAALRGRATVALGEVLALLGNRDEAEMRFLEAINLYAKTDAVHEAYIRLGDLQRQSGKHDAAHASYDAVANNTAAPMNLRLQAFVGKADAAIASEKFNDAARIYATIFSTFKDQSFDADIYRKAADASRQSGDLLAAGRYLDQLYRDTLITVDRKAVLKEIAATAEDAKKFNDAIQAYQLFLRKYATDEASAFALLAIGRIAEAEFTNSALAIESYNGVLDRYGASAAADDALFGKGRALERAGKFDEAADTYAQLSVQFPSSPFLAEAETRSRDLKRFRPGAAGDAVTSIAAILAAMSEKPSSASVDVLLGSLYLNDLKDFKAAQRSFASALRKGAEGEDAERASYGEAMASLRLAQQAQGNRTAAEQALMQFIERYPSSAFRDKAGYELYLFVSEGQQPAIVLDAASKYLALNPAMHVADVRLAFADASRESGRLTEAEQEYTKLINEQQGAIAARALYGRGLVRQALMNFTGAIDDFRACERENPGGRNTADALMTLGKLLVRTGRYNEAVQSFEAIADRFNYSPLADSAQIALLDALSESGRHDLASVRAEQFLSRAKENPFRDGDMVGEYQYRFAAILAKARDATGAKRALQQYVADNPRGKRLADVYYALGHIFKDEGKTVLATSYFQQAGSLITGNITALQDAADLLLETGRYSEAIREYEKIATSTSASHIEKSYAHSRIVVALFRSEKATDAQQRAAEFKSRYPDAQPVLDEFELERGKHLFRQKQYEPALDVFENLEDSETQEVAAMGVLWAGKTFEAQSINDKAQQRFDDVLKKYPATEAAMEAHLSIARVSFRAEKYDVAAQSFKSVVDHPRASQSALKEALGGLINCYDELRMYDAAAEMTKRFVATWPNDPTAFRKRVNLGVFYYQLGYFDQAVMHLKNLLSEASPDDQAEIRYYIGESYYYKGDFTQAALEFLAVPYLIVQKTEIDWTASAYYMAGQSYEKQNKFDLALDMYKKIVDTQGLDPRFKAQAQKEIQRVQALVKP